MNWADNDYMEKLDYRLSNMAYGLGSEELKAERLNMTIEEVAEMRADALKWRSHVAKMQNNLPNHKSAEERSESARRAVQARWAKAKKEQA